MSEGFIYTRKFVILKRDLAKNLKIKPKGHARIEIRGNKGTMNITLEEGYKDWECGVYLIGRDNGRIVDYYLGRIITNERGKGNINVSFNPKNIENSNLSIDKFNGIVIKKGINVLLTGYIDKEDGTIENYLRNLSYREEPIEEKVEEKSLDVHENIEEVESYEEIETDEEFVEEEKAEIEKIVEVEEEKVVEEAEKVEEEESHEEMKAEEIAEEEKVEVDKSHEYEKIQETDTNEIDKGVEEVEEVVKEEPVELEAIREDEEIEELKGIEKIAEEADKVEIEEIDDNTEAEDVLVEETQIEKEIIEEEEFEGIDLLLDEESDCGNLKKEEARKIQKYLERLEEERKNQPEHKAESNNVDWHEANIKNRDLVENMRRQNYKTQMTNYALNILKFFPKVNPFISNLNNYEWWKIEYNSMNMGRGFLPFYNYLMNMCYDYPFMPKVATCLDQIKKYNHYLFGLYKEHDEIKYYVYGIPGKYVVEEHPFRGITGFNTWYSSEERNGYWLIYIDPLTGKVIFPINPMVPSN